VVKNNIDPAEARLDFNKDLIVGKFVDIDRPTFLDNYQAMCRRQWGDWPDIESKKHPKGKQAVG
jgi:2-oxoglutarate/2-oxoacid ferredoxin oxidoreductase subunit beta